MNIHKMTMQEFKRFKDNLPENHSLYTNEFTCDEAYILYKKLLDSENISPPYGEKDNKKMFYEVFSHRKVMEISVYGAVIQARETMQRLTEKKKLETDQIYYNFQTAQSN